MGFWDLMESMRQKADNMKSNYIRDVEDKANKVLSNPSAYSKEQLEIAQKNRDKARSARRGEYQPPEPNEIEDRYEGYEDEDEEEWFEEDEDDKEKLNEQPELDVLFEEAKAHEADIAEVTINARNKYHHNSIAVNLNYIGMWLDSNNFDEIANTCMPDAQKKLLDVLGISHGYYVRNSVSRELYSAASNPIAQEYVISGGYEGDILKFAMDVEEKTRTRLSEAYNDRFDSFYYEVDAYGEEAVVNRIEKEYPVPEIEGFRFLPILVYADVGLHDLENGFIVYALCKVAEDNSHCYQLALAMKAGKENYSIVPFSQIYKIESKRNEVVINNNYRIRASDPENYDDSKYYCSQVLKYILNLCLFQEWKIKEPKFLSIKLEQISNVANSDTGNALLNERHFLEFLMGTQDRQK